MRLFFRPLTKNMDFATILTDVEQQLALVTQIVQVHTDAVLKAGSDHPYLPNTSSIRSIPVLINNVDQAQNNLEQATTRFLELMNQVVQPPSSTAQVNCDEETETEDEFEENKADVPVAMQVEGQESTTGQVEAQRDTKVEPLEKYLMVAKEVSLAIESTDHDGDDVFRNLDPAVVEMWNEAVKKLFQPATQKFRKLLTDGGLNDDIIARFCQATTLAVALSTSTKGISTYKKNTQNRWRMWAIKQLAAIHELGLKSAFSDELHSIRDDCDTLIRCCDGHISKAVKELAASTRTTSLDTLQIDAKRKKIHKFDEKLREICIFIILRNEVQDLESWSDTQWEDFSAIDRNLMVLVKSAFYQDEIAKKFKLLYSIVEQFYVKMPDRSPSPLLELFRTAAADSTSLSGLKRPREDQSYLNDQAKRIAMELSKLEDSFKAEMKNFMEMVTSLPSFEGVNLTSKSLKEIQRVFTKMTEITTRFGKVISRTEANTVAFGEATKITVDIIRRISCGFLPRTKLKHWLARLRPILRRSRWHYSNSPGTVVFEESVNRLQQHWDETYLDPFAAIRKHVDATDVQDMDSNRLQKAVLQLIGHFNHACNTAWGEICQGVPTDRENDIRAKFLEFGNVLSDWLQRILHTGDQLPGFIEKLTPKLVRIDRKLPNTVPATLFEYVRMKTQV
ncbi:hypothetical protein P3T76_004429 [Phytophthora citrophthora]|uniref:Uncharacterized protein n=1 Tax=Phytophthora citrophthora TaxID=4793 RepID=A0AAD9GTT2_9STRA|nr:hypothetical protein P3T76_004429 [Phytophthora citrophthora]